MSAELQPVRAVVATVLGGLVGGLGLAALVGHGAQALAEPGAGGGLEALLYAFVGFVVGATLGAAGALAWAFRGERTRGRGVTVLTVLAGGLFWAVAWWLEPVLIWAGIVVLPAAALVGRAIATR
ncbi:hypothetical protein [Modestobacter sp. VKM Ac-2985]|uniref:hypothetical protein n=1 Tax=Modestobacter sp. VKM Ac-2985 TaxID=3004139 RepID=UPI0022AB8976|nr:hypothetical protein [Modestobacter sp. VKM Ac-2985]MCZ2839766.1 hypothetical protein [Modestobacter sp. VKM Ac-2985]